MSGVTGENIDEIFIGSYMTNMGHLIGVGELLLRASSVNTRFRICPPTRMDPHRLMEERYYTINFKDGARTKMPRGSLCMENQARVLGRATVISASTRNFLNR